MNYKIELTAHFEKEIKRLSKKYPSIKSDFANLVSLLTVDPFIGDSLGNHCYKIRLSITSKGKGKSGGARVITHVYIAAEKVYLVSIYDKGEKDSISEKEVEQILKGIRS